MQYYVLLSGRWFTAHGRKGPWKYIDSQDLPADFRKISPESPKADVLVSIAGTEEAKEAVIEATIPQTTTVERSKVAPLKVEYDGLPEFSSISNSDLSYAVNTDYTVIKSGNKYYCCNDAVWYISNNPLGPWAAATSVPDEIYSMTPESPVYNVKYVKIYNYNQAGNEITYGYTSGYEGCYYYNGVIVYGTGYYYKPWCRRRYHPRPVTYGFHARYNRYSGNWRCMVGYRNKFGRITSWTPTFNTGWRWRCTWHGRYRPRYQHHKVYNNYRYKHYRKKSTRSINRNNLTIRNNRASKHYSNNVLSDRKGHIYRKTLGGWEKRTKGQWQQLEHHKIRGKSVESYKSVPQKVNSRKTVNKLFRPTQASAKTARRPTRRQTAQASAKTTRRQAQQTAQVEKKTHRQAQQTAQVEKNVLKQTDLQTRQTARVEKKAHRQTRWQTRHVKKAKVPQVRRQSSRTERQTTTYQPKRNQVLYKQNSYTDMNKEIKSRYRGSYQTQRYHSYRRQYNNTRPQSSNYVRTKSFSGTKRDSRR